MNTLRKWLRGLTLMLVTIVAVLTLTGAVYQTLSNAADRKSFPFPGQLVDVGGYRMHIHCMGEGSPTVILDSANMGTVSNWDWIQPEIAKTTRVCAYERADSGWSNVSPQPNDTRRNAKALHILLQNAGVSGPYVLAGLSFGGLYMRMFAERYPDEVAGIIFIDGTLPDGLMRLGKPDVMPNAPDAGMIDAPPFISHLSDLRLMGFSGTDPDLPEPQRSELQAYLSSTKWAEMIKRQYHLFPTFLEQARPLYTPGSLGEIPVAVVLGSEGDGGFAEQARLSTNHTTVVVKGANHIRLVDRREHAMLTGAATIRVIEAARSNQPLQ